MEIVMNERDLIVSKTDLKGRIVYGNETFIKLSGYTERELLQSPHSILRHEDMPKTVFKMLWERIQEKRPINAYVKNRTKDGKYYWVFGNVTASVDSEGEVVGYYSVRRKPSQKGVQSADALYRELCEAERVGGIREGMKMLNDRLANMGVTYDEFVLDLQK